MSNNRSTLDSLAGGLLNIIVTIGWVLMFVFMLSGWYRLLHAKDRSRWSDGELWAARVLIWWALSFIVGFTVWLLTDKSPSVMTWMLKLPTQLVWLVGVSGGPFAMVVAWIINTVVYKQNANQHYETNRRNSKVQGDPSLDRLVEENK